jgi:gliding motility-associated-like protein
VDIRPDPVFTVSGAGNVCRDDSVQLHAGGGDLYTWQPAGSLNNPSVSNPMASPQTATNYQVQITDTVCHNVGNLSTSIGVLELPTVKASRSADIDCTNDRSQLNATGASTYSWTPVGTLNNPSIQNPIATPTSPTRYTVKGTDGFGCINYDTVTVDVINVNAGGYLMPSAFSPNNDGKNDCFGVRYWGVIQKIDFSVYNRWGNLIFHTKTVGDCWDGTYHGVPQNPDVYVFLITAKTSCGEVFRKGTFVLVR